MKNFSMGVMLIRFIAEEEARNARFEAILPEHFWMALCKVSELPDGILSNMLKSDAKEKTAFLEEVAELRAWLKKQQFDTTHVRRKLRSRLGRGPGSPAGMHRSPESRLLFDVAAQLAENDRRIMTGMLHLAQAIWQNQPAALLSVLAEPAEKVEDLPPTPKEQASPAGLERFGRDLTALAAGGALDPLIGRKAELRRLAQILVQKRKGNALLVGDAGVGKTCLVEGLAQRMVSPKCPPVFKGVRILEISMSQVVAGIKYRGDFEQRMGHLIREAENNPQLILFIDELHTMMKAGGGGIGAADILKPALARGKIRIIGATTTQEYEQQVLKDDAIARRFEVLWIEEPPREEALAILSGAKAGFEEHHDVSISDEALEAAVDLSQRYLPERRLPDKAFDLLDQACAQRVFQSLWMTAEGELATLAEEARVVERADIARVVSERCQVPSELLAVSDQERLTILESYLSHRILGQQAAMRDISTTLRAVYQGLRDPRRPIAVMLFAGPTGVGKTETAKALAEFLFGSADGLIRIDLSEYGEKHQVARLLGAPPGYVDSERPGLLTSALRHRPASVVLFDEIEKAHPDVLNVLLQILDEGQLTDGQGRKASFREAVVILTTNILPTGRAKRPLGFRAEAPDDQESPPDKREGVRHVLQRHLRPELIGRLKHIIMFEALGPETGRAIAEGVLARVEERLRETGGILTIPEEIRQSIFAKLTTLRFGAREIEQLVETEVAAWLIRVNEPEQTVSSSTATASSAAGVMFSAMKPATPQKVALLVLDLVQSTQLVVNVGDTYFNTLIGTIYKHFRQHPSASENIFLKCTGDGFLAVFTTVSSAFSMAASFLQTPLQGNVHLRIALNWGEVKTGPDGDVLGKEVHRVCRIEGVSNQARLEPSETVEPFPIVDRILITAEALAQLSPAERERFQPVGAFHLKGFDDPCQLWLYSA